MSEIDAHSLFPVAALWPTSLKLHSSWDLGAHFHEHRHFLREARFRFIICGTKSYSVEVVTVCLPFKYSFSISFELNNFAGKLAHA